MIYVYINRKSYLRPLKLEAVFTLTLNVFYIVTAIYFWMGGSGFNQLK